jgi:hypothetical protein
VAKAIRTHPFDLVVAVRLLQPATTLSPLADELGVAPSQVHAALGRLETAGLLRPGSRSTNVRALGEFIVGGVRYAFPVVRGPLTEGIPTAYSTAPLAAVVDAVDVVVWPAPQAEGRVRGFSLTPLYSRAPILAERSPETYRVVSIIDAFRLGEARIRSMARAELERALGRRFSDAG